MEGQLWRTFVGKASRKKRERKLVALEKPYSVRLSPRLKPLLEQHGREHEARTGRPPKPHDLILGDVDPDDLTQYTIARLRALGAGGDVIEAYLATERIVLPNARATLPAEAVAEWDRALAEARERNPTAVQTDLDELQRRADAELGRAARAARPQ
jgi:hypothetical protein